MRVVYPSATAAIQFQYQQQSPLMRGVFPATRKEFSISIRTNICFPQRRRLSFFKVKSVESSSTVDELQDFLNPSDEECEDHIDGMDLDEHISTASPTNLPLDSKKLKAMARMTEIGTDGQLPPNTLSLIDIGLDLDRIKQIACKDPSITTISLEKKIKPLVEFLLDLGVPPSDIPNIFYRVPHLCDLSLSENIIPSMAYLETLGMDKSKRAKAIRQFPQLLMYNRRKVEATVDYLYELGLPRNRIAKVLTRCPQIISRSIDATLRPKAGYFRSMGVNLTSLLNRYPEVFGRSIECQLKPVTEFLLDKGFGIDDIGTMASRFGSIYSLSLTKNLIPKWDFFLTMDYSRSELVKHPIYFGCSLEGRIKPRYSQMKECGVMLSFSRFIYPSDSGFLKILNEMKMKKILEAQHDSMAVTSDEDL